MITDAFENGIFPLPKQPPSGLRNWEDYETDLLQPSPRESHALSSSVQCEEKAKNIASELNRQIAEKNKIINKELLKKYFRFQNLISMQKEMCKTKNACRNNKLVNVIKTGLKDLKKKDIEEMSNDVKEIEKPNEIADIIEMILEFN